MKKIIFFIFLLSLCHLLPAQKNNSSLRIGLKAGLSTSDINVDELKILDEGGLERLDLAVKDAKYGLHGGLVIQAKLGNFLIQPEVLFNSSEVDYNVDELTGGSIISTVRSEKYQYLDIPILLGYKAGPLRLHAGPVGHIFINSRSEFFDLTGVEYRQKFDEMTWGWQGGLGLDIWNLMIDFRYEGNFTKFGNHLNFAGRQYQFDNSPSRFVASVGYLF